MPLTAPAHQLLVIPLVRGRRSPLPGVALLLGSALPDLAFCVGGYRLNVYSHLWWGPLFMSATLGLLLYVWLEALLLPVLTFALPAHGRAPLARLCVTRGVPASAEGWAWALAALVIGSYSHVLFDGFTHDWMWPANVLYPDTTVDLGPLGRMGLAHALQIGFSVLGSVVVLWWAWRLVRRAPPLERAPERPRGFGHLCAGAAFGALAGLVLGLVVYGWPGSKRELVLLMMSPVPVGAFAGVTIAAWQLRALAGDDDDVEAA